MNIADQGIPAFVNRLDPLISFRAKGLTRGGNVCEFVHAHIDDDCARFDEIPTNKGRSANSRDKDVRLSCYSRQVARLRMTDGDSRMSLQEQTRHWSADNLTATDDASIRARNFNPISIQQL